MNKKGVSFLIALSLALSINTNVVMAKPANGQAVNIKAQDKSSELESRIQQMDNNIETLMIKVQKNKQDIEQNKKDIQRLEKEVEKAQKEIEARKAMFNKRVRAMYISGVNSYADIILESKGLSDLISRIENVKKIMDFDKGVIKELKDKKEEVKQKKIAMNNKASSLIALKQENESKLSQMQRQKESEKVALRNLKVQEQQKRQAEQRAQQNVNQNTTTTRSSNKSYSRGGSSVTPSRKTPLPPSAVGGSVVGYAQQFLGTPYVWGGTSPSGFDCSGFVQYVYGNCGVGLPRVAESQQGVGNAVSRGDLQAGDLVFWGSPAHHVGIYIGGGQYIHAPHTGDVVKISPLNGYTNARRLR